ncbi:MAG: LicD family protein [Kiritimatiellae bacterium]|nr:LicD family protein [Kiritimatiellia bacterium]
MEPKEKKFAFRPLWDAMLDMYRAFAEICDRHGLRYYIYGGTLLGAARHKGFIPWDDDFDVAMPRRDYRKFFDLYAKELPPHLRGFDFRSLTPQDKFRCMFGKVVETRDEKVAAIAKAVGLNLSGGVFIDIIPMDGMPCAALPFYWWALRRTVWRHAASLSTRPWYTRPFWRAVAALWRIPENERERGVRFEEWLMRWDYDSAPAVESYLADGRRLKMRKLSSASMGEPVYLPFEGVKMPCPREWEKYLEIIYGDWRELPPPEKRVPSHQEA